MQGRGYPVVDGEKRKKEGKECQLRAEPVDPID
jgi:hypothetical protein